MITLTIKELLDCLSEITIDKLYCDSEVINSTKITNIDCDSRKISANSVFVAIIGETNDGHKYLQQVRDKQACLAILSKTDNKVKLPQLQVTDTRKALGLITQLLSEKWHKPKIAITGSSGKTTTKFILNSILKTKGEVLCAESSFNNDIGVPLTMFNASEQHWAGIFEMGTNHPGEIGYLSSLVKTDIAIITNISISHIGNFASLDAIAEEKSSIFKSLKSTGLAIINQDDQYCDYFKQVVSNINTQYNSKIKICTFGLDNQADIYATEIQVLPNCTRFNLNYNAQVINVELALLGMHQVLNSLAAAASALTLGLSLEEIKTGLGQVQPVVRRMQPFVFTDKITLIDDSYNASYAAVLAAMQFLGSLPGKRILVLGDLAELGSKAQDVHTKIGEQAREYNIDHLLAFGNYSKYTLRAFKQSSNTNQLADPFTDKQELIKYLLRYLTDYNKLNQPCTVLVKGANSMRMWEVTEGIQNLTDLSKVEDN